MIPETKRQYYLDWIRVITILLVFFFHCARFFDYDDWHVKNRVLSDTANTFTFLLVEWMMPMFFFISGASTWYALQKKNGQKFISDRVKRILVPLIFGIFILSPHQVYLERLTHGQFKGSVIDFLPHYFSGLYAFGGNFAWMGLHLWYLLLLFVFSLITLPLLLAIKKRRMVTSTGGTLFYLAGFIILLFIPGTLLKPYGIPGGRMWGGWSMIEHLVLFISGYYAFSKPGITNLWSKYSYFFLCFAVILTAANLYLFLNNIRYDFGTPAYLLKLLLRAAVCYSWLFAILGFAEKNLNFTDARLNYCNEAVLPFYILHQPVIILIGYFIVHTSFSIGLKYLLIALSSFFIVVLVYHVIVRNISVARFLFGMGKKKA